MSRAACRAASSTASPSGRRACRAGTRRARRFRGEQAPPATPATRPAPSCWPPTERRRAPDTVAVALEVAAARVRSRRPRRRRRCRRCSPPRTATSPSTTTCARRSPSAPTLISPTKFHNSVHNAAAGYWTHRHRLPRGRAPRSARSTHTFGAGLLEAATQCLRRGDDRCCWSPFDVEAAGALASVTAEPRPARLRAGARAARGRAHGWRRSSWSLASATTRAAPIRSPAARSLAGNAMAAHCRCSKRSRRPAVPMRPITLPLTRSLALVLMARLVTAAAGQRHDRRHGRRELAVGDDPRRRHDVVILGGGLAGLTLAMQLKQRVRRRSTSWSSSGASIRCRRPRTRSANRRSRSAPTTSTQVLGLEEHLETRAAEEVRLPLLLLGRARATSTRCTELGASRYLADAELSARPRHLRELPRRACARARRARSSTARSCAASSSARRRRRASRSLRARRRSHEVRARWLVDACRPRRPDQAQARARAGQRPRRERDLVPHRRADRRSTSGRRRAPGSRAAIRRHRWLSTNHLCGEGYWAWLIPLASGLAFGRHRRRRRAASARDDEHVREGAGLVPGAPAAAARGARGKRDLLQDFAFLRDFSYGCKQVFSGERWALTGEAGLFLDPFYSPGSDFIAIANTYIVRADRARPRRPSRSTRMRTVYRADLPLVLREHAVAVPRPVPDLRRPRGDAGQGDLGLHLLLGRAVPAVLPAPPHRPAPRCRCCAPSSTIAARSTSKCRRCCAPGRRLARREVDNPAVMLDQADLPWFAELNRSLLDPLDEAAFRERIRFSTRQMRSLAAEIARARGAQRRCQRAAATHRRRSFVRQRSR